jgi:hypothetical protein
MSKRVKFQYVSDLYSDNYVYSDDYLNIEMFSDIIRSNNYCPTQLKYLISDKLIQLIIDNIYKYPALSGLAFRTLVEREYLKIIIKIDQQPIDIDTFVLNKTNHFLDLDIIIDQETISIIKFMPIYKSISYDIDKTNNNILDNNILDNNISDKSYYKDISDYENDPWRFIYINNNMLRLSYTRQLIHLFCIKYKKIISQNQLHPTILNKWKFIKRLAIFGVVGLSIYSFKKIYESFNI